MKPILDRLPDSGYRSNPVATWLTSWADQDLLRVRTILETWYWELSPDTCQDASLDYLSSLLGFSGVYWDTKWTVLQKRQILKVASQLWQYRGTTQGINLILQYLVPEYTLWTSGKLTMPFDLPGSFGRNDMRLYIRLPLKYPVQGKEFREANRVVQGYCPAVVRSEVVYDRFYLGFSTLGQPMFTK